jgi:hypothetical protein
MEIVIGAAPRVGPPQRKGPGSGPGYLEARVLNVRPPRRRPGDPAGDDERRKDRGIADPASGRVVVLMIPEGYNLPQDIDNGNYRVFLRFVPQRH